MISHAIIRMEASGCLGINGGQLGMQAGTPRVLARCLQLLPQRGVRRRRGQKTLQQRTHVEPGPADHHGQVSTLADSRDRLERVRSKPRDVVALVGIHDVDEVMDAGEPAPRWWAFHVPMSMPR
jgi:hypothetical protein